MSPGPRLCLTLVVQDDAVAVERTLRSVHGIADACIAGDAGSTDGSPALIRAFCAANGIACEMHEVARGDDAKAWNDVVARARASAVEFDYLLLCEPGAEVVVTDPLAFSALRDGAARVRADEGICCSDDVRLLRRDAPGGYEGIARPRLVVPGDPALLEGVRVVLRAAGENEARRLARAEPLLRARLAQEPGDATSMHDLARTLEAEGRFAEAAEWYARRVAAGGDAEECWHACYRLALCRQAQGDVAGFLTGCRDAYRMLPTRMEPLMRVARHLAATGRIDDAIPLAEGAAAVPWPAGGRRFVEPDAYGPAAREALAAVAVGGTDSPAHATGRRGAEALAIDAAATPAQRALARSRVLLYARPFAASFPGATVARIGLRLTAPYAATNPCIVRDGDGYLGVIRAVNYALVNGCYEVPGSDLIMRSQNFLVRMAGDFRIVAARRIRDHTGLPCVVERLPPDATRVATCHAEGFEDCRVFHWRGGWWCSATTYQLEQRRRAVMVLLRLGADCSFEHARQLIGYRDDIDQKNWMPVVGDRLRYVYGLSPTIVLDATMADGPPTVESSVDPGFALDHWRGGPPLLPWGAGYLSVLHEKRMAPKGSSYTHRFVEFDARCVPVAASDAFHFVKPGVEFASGLTPAVDADRLVVSFGVDDRAAYVATVPAAAIRASLRPLGMSS
jgi:hypothetical protein